MNYKDASLSIEARTEHLLGLMTLQEKAGQLVQLFGWKVYERHGGQITLTESFKEEAAQGKIGSLYGVLRADPWTEVTLETGLSPREGAETMNAIQRYAIEHSRLGIPILFGEECSHGHMAIGATVFPVPLSLASAWNLELYERICRAIALETRSQGGAATYSPVLDVVRDPRWGRTEETYGEDPYLASVMAEAAVRGLQGERLDADDSVVATLKHFAGYGSSEGGRNSAFKAYGAAGAARGGFEAVSGGRPGRSEIGHDGVQRNRRHPLHVGSVFADGRAAEAVGLRRVRHHGLRGDQHARMGT